jgi:hypothetical protein
MKLTKLKKRLGNLPIFGVRRCFILHERCEEFGRQDFYLLTKKELNEWEKKGLTEKSKLYKAKFIKEYK